jgi:hypothetical protein
LKEVMPHSRLMWMSAKGKGGCRRSHGPDGCLC